ncbi:uncharacterized protein LOC143645689 [Tamandua tetradactyla]|uniref:uncharacterized protein LOC143645689 n=1 Tax=Tamandua tetradactyla TaxID=48850 RepID=UPI004053A849
MLGAGCVPGGGTRHSPGFVESQHAGASGTFRPQPFPKQLASAAAGRPLHFPSTNLRASRLQQSLPQRSRDKAEPARRVQRPRGCPSRRPGAFPAGRLPARHASRARGTGSPQQPPLYPGNLARPLLGHGAPGLGSEHSTGFASESGLGGAPAPRRPRCYDQEGVPLSARSTGHLLSVGPDASPLSRFGHGPRQQSCELIDKGPSIKAQGAPARSVLESSSSSRVRPAVASDPTSDTTGHRPGNNKLGCKVAGGLFLLHLIIHVAATSIDPAEPSVWHRKSYCRLVPSFNCSKHAHVIENQYCHLCQVNVCIPPRPGSPRVSESSGHPDSDGCPPLFEIRAGGWEKPMAAPRVGCREDQQLFSTWF